MIAMKILDLLLGAILARLYRWVGLAGLRPNMNRVTQNVWVGGINHPNVIANEGFDAVLDLRTKDAGKYRWSLEESGIEYFNVRIPDDHGAPPEILLKIVQWIANRIKLGKKILIHCNLGRGRAPLAMVSYLVHEGATAESAIKSIKEKRRVTFLNAEQNAALEKFSDSISPRGTGDENRRY